MNMHNFINQVKILKTKTKNIKISCNQNQINLLNKK